MLKTFILSFFTKKEFLYLLVINIVPLYQVDSLRPMNPQADSISLTVSNGTWQHSVMVTSGHLPGWEARLKAFPSELQGWSNLSAKVLCSSPCKEQTS